MRKGRFTEDQIIAILREHETEAQATTELCRKHGISTTVFYRWKAKYGGLEVSDARRLRSLEEENRRLTKLLAAAMLDSAMLFGSWRVLRDSRVAQAQKLDLGGVVLLSLTLALLVYPLIEGPETGWPAWMIAMLIACLATLLAFVHFEARLAVRGGDPLVTLSLFRSRRFRAGVVMALAFYMLSSFYLTFALYLQSGQHRSAMDAGIGTLPFAIGLFLR